MNKLHKLITCLLVLLTVFPLQGKNGVTPAKECHCCKKSLPNNSCCCEHQKNQPTQADNTIPNCCDLTSPSSSNGMLNQNKISLIQQFATPILGRQIQNFFTDKYSETKFQSNCIRFTSSPPRSLPLLI